MDKKEADGFLKAFMPGYHGDDGSLVVSQKDSMFADVVCLATRLHELSRREKWALERKQWLNRTDTDASDDGSEEDEEDSSDDD